MLYNVEEMTHRDFIKWDTISAKNSLKEALMAISKIRVATLKNFP